MRIATLTCLPGPSPFLFLLAQLLLWLLLLLPGREFVGAASCPSLCTCSNQASRVICTRQNLEQVPESISVNTRYLNLQENSIQKCSSKRRKDKSRPGDRKRHWGFAELSEYFMNWKHISTTPRCLSYALPIHLESLDGACGFTAAEEDHLTTEC